MNHKKLLLVVLLVLVPLMGWTRDLPELVE